MIVNLTTVIELSGLNDIQAKEIKDTIKNSGIDASIRSDVIFIDSDIDNSDRYVEILSCYLAERLPFESETILTVKDKELDVVGSALEGYYDIIIKNGEAVMVPYNIVKSISMQLKVEVK